MATTKNTGDASEEHSVDNADAGTPATEPFPTAPAPEGEQAEAQKASAERRAENLPEKQVEAELTHGVDPVDGSELPLAQAQATGQPVMVPESKGDIRTDVTYPRHIQAPPVEQVAPGELTKRNSSTEVRRQAARAAAKK